MKQSKLAATLLCLATLGCGDTEQHNSLDFQSSTRTKLANAPDTGAAQESPSQELVSGFTTPRLKGLAVLDHPEGAQVVTPNAEYQRGLVFTRINGTPVSNAVGFRDQTNILTSRGEEFELDIALFLTSGGQ